MFYDSVTANVAFSCADLRAFVLAHTLTLLLLLLLLSALLATTSSACACPYCPLTATEPPADSAFSQHAFTGSDFLIMINLPSFRFSCPLFSSYLLTVRTMRIVSPDCRFCIFLFISRSATRLSGISIFACAHTQTVYALAVLFRIRFAQPKKSSCFGNCECEPCLFSPILLQSASASAPFDIY